MAKDYISDVFENNQFVGDVQQEMQYNLIKAYPSNNSANGGNVHSEENVRWLTRQFTKKPFIIPYDNNEDFKEFDYEGVTLYAGATTGGMANIDGYIFNMADVIGKTSFNNSDDTYLSTGGSGYISHQRLQRAISQFMNGLQSSDWEQYPIYIGSYDFSELNIMISNTYKKLIGEPYELPTMDDDKLYLSPSSVDIEYTDADLISYISNHFNLSTLVDDYDFVTGVSVTSTSITVTYRMYFGIINNKLKPIKTNEGVYNSYVFIKDIFGFNYIWKYEDMYVSTHVYPSTLNADLNFLEDNITLTLAGNDETKKTTIKTNTTWKLENIYDCSELYKEYTPTSGTSFYNYLEDAVNENLWPVDTNNNACKPYVRDDTDGISNTQKNLNDYFNGTNNAFDTVSASDVIGVFTNYNEGSAPTDSDFTRDNYHTGKLYKLSDNYYCLPLDRLSTGDSTSVMDFLCLKYNYGNNPNIPVGFLTSSGALMARNYEYGNYLYIEGYVSFVRRVCAKFCNINYLNTTGSYGDISNPNAYNHDGWNRLIKDFQTGVISFDDGANASKWANILGVNVNDLSTIKFQDIYNVFIAPYANFHLQLAWSANYTFDLNNSPVAKYKTHHAYSIISNNLDPSINPLTDSEIGLGDLAAANIHINLPITHSFTHGSDTYNASRAVTYYYNQYTDYGRLDNFLCSRELHTYDPEHDATRYYDKIDLSNTANISELCEDYITYLKHCSAKGYEQTYNGVNVNSGIMSSNKNPAINILYKVTNLTNNSSTYGFNDLGDIVVDRLAKYVPVKINDYDTDYVGATTNVLPIIPSHINNVAIRLDTLMPSERNPYDESFYCYPTQTSGTVDSTNVTLADTYVLEYFTYSTVEYDGEQTYGLSGYGLQGNSQGWAVAVPTLFRLYKDAQNHLNGNKPGTGIHDGIKIDYAFPNDITNYDFWFANSWLTPVSKLTVWEIENTGTSYPKTTDGMVDYLYKRNYTILSIDQIYNITDSGDYNDLSQTLNDAKKYTDYVVNNNPTQSFVVATPNTTETPHTLEYSSQLVTGINNVAQSTTRRINHIEKQYLDSGTLTDPYNVQLENNKYVDLRTNGVLDFITITADREFANLFSDDYNDGIDTEYAKLFHMTIRTDVSNSFRIYLNDSLRAVENNTNTVLNGNIPITWDSNYTIVSNALYVDDAVNTNKNESSYIEVTNPNLDVGDSSGILIDMTITYDEDNNQANAYCDVSTVNNVLTDVNTTYLVRQMVKQTYALENMSWADISKYTKLGLAPELWSVGDTKTFNFTDTVASETTSITAMIIGFNQDGDNTITWMTLCTGEQTVGNQTEQPYLGPTYKNQKTTSELGTTSDWIDGYNKGDTSGYSYTGTELYQMLNNFKFTALEIPGVYRGIENDLLQIILPARKISRPLYLVKDTDNNYHRYGDTIADDIVNISNIGYYREHNIPYGTWVDINDSDVYAYDRYGKYNRGDYIWLPSIYELGLTPINPAVDDAEHNAYYNSIYDNTDIRTYESLRIHGKTKSANGPVIQEDGFDTPVFTYEYFKKHPIHSFDNTISKNIVCRSYYAVRSDDIPGVTTWSTEEYADLYSRYLTAPRTYHVVANTLVPSTTDYAYTVMDRTTAEGLGTYFLTEFCFVTH